MRERLSPRLAAAFEGLTLVPGSGTTELVGEVADQAQLHGLLTRIRDLGMTRQAVIVSDAPVSNRASAAHWTPSTNPQPTQRSTPCP